MSFNHDEQVNVGDNKQLTSTSWAAATSTTLGVLLVEKLKFQRRRWGGIFGATCTGRVSKRTKLKKLRRRGDELVTGAEPPIPRLESLPQKSAPYIVIRLVRSLEDGTLTCLEVLVLLGRCLYLMETSRI